MRSPNSPVMLTAADSMDQNKWLHQIQSNALKWYDRHARDLPWRRTHDPYAIWVSEIMLQQTQVATVIDYYHRFLATYPDVNTLAAANEQDVLRHWSGLGYYRRARQMHAAAKRVADSGEGFPRTLEAIETLPGIGRYTAGAIASFAYDLPAPIVEVNTMRLFSRLLKLQIDPRSRDGQAQLWSFAESIVGSTKGKRESPGRVNQALMELGSQVCTPREPNCLHCPLRAQCPTFAAGLQLSIPVAAAKKVITDLTHAAIIVRNSKNEVLMRQNAANEWWHGLWDLPRVDVSHAASFHKRVLVAGDLPAAELEWLAAAFDGQHGVNCTVVGHHSSLKHAVTRYRIALHAFSATIKPRSRIGVTFSWHSIAQALDLPLTAPAKRILKSLQKT